MAENHYLKIQTNKMTFTYYNYRVVIIESDMKSDTVIYT